MTLRRWFFLIVFVFVLFSLRLVNRDFYTDELWTLDHFLFIPCGDICGKYVNASNHVLYSLLNALYLRLIGVRGIDTLLTHPWMIRLPQLAFQIATFALVYEFGKRYISERVGVLAVLLLATTLPYSYYSCAIRGYGMSMMLFMTLLFFVFDIQKKGY